MFADLFPSLPVAFSSPYSVDVSCDKLSAALPADTMSNRVNRMFKGGIFMRMKKPHIIIWRVRPMQRNSFKPMLYATLIADGNQSVVKGNFRCHKGVKYFTMFWLSAVGIPFVVFLAHSLGSGTWSRNHGTLMNLFLMLLFGVFISRFGWWLARKDIDIISATVKNILE